jgi:hypothetical protein
MIGVAATIAAPTIVKTLLVDYLYDKVTNFYSLLFADKNHRYKSWEHCYSYFTDDVAQENIDTSCLHLSFC